MRKIISSIFFISAFCIASNQIFAQCKCSLQNTVQEAFKRSDVVFAAKVIEAKKISEKNTDNYDVLVKFEVEQAWKQDLEKFVTVKAFQGRVTYFEQGSEWLLYASKNEDGTFKIVIHCCSRTKLLSVTSGDLKSFEEMGEKPKRILEN
ncbi:MAG: hypothetical protein M3209_06785 [Acidobacteriota bacterium]|nr:hypothetical protein [Acidobacteriota bacterium]